MNSIMEAVHWVCDDILDDHEWVSKICVSLQESKVLETSSYDIEVPYVVQWEMLWCWSDPREI